MVARGSSATTIEGSGDAIGGRGAGSSSSGGTSIAGDAPEMRGCAGATAAVGDPTGPDGAVRTAASASAVDMPPLEFDLPSAPSTDEIGDDGGSSVAAGAALRVLISDVGDSGFTPPVTLRARGGGRPGFVGVGGGFAPFGRAVSASSSTRSISDVVCVSPVAGSWPAVATLVSLGVASARAAALGAGVASALIVAIGPGVTRLVDGSAPLALLAPPTLVVELVGEVDARDAAVDAGVVVAREASFDEVPVDGFAAGEVVAREIPTAGVAAGDVVAREAAFGDGVRASLAGDDDGRVTTFGDDLRASPAMGGADVDERVTTFGDDVRASLVDVRASGARLVAVWPPAAGVPAGGVTADSFTSFASAASWTTGVC